MSLVFYDVTTLYFESDREDEFRQKGYSKDHRHDMPQVLVSLCVDQDGYPFDLEYFEGKTFEGHTLPKMIDSLKRRYTFDRLTVVADAGMLSKDNLDFLEEKQIGYIVGARLKNLPQNLKDQITHNYQEQSVYETTYQDRDLIVDWSLTRAKKDRFNRDRQIQRLEKRLQKQQTVIRKSKYLKTSRKNQVVGIDQSKIQEDAAFDGLKGYLTNTREYLSAQRVIDHYHSLWRVEKAFRMSKHDLRERPIYHSKPERIIKAHLLLCFVSLVVIKETENILQAGGYSLERTIELLGQVGEGKIKLGKTTLPLESESGQQINSLIKLFVGH